MLVINVSVPVATMVLGALVRLIFVLVPLVPMAVTVPLLLLATLVRVQLVFTVLHAHNGIVRHRLV